MWGDWFQWVDASANAFASTVVNDATMSSLIPIISLPSLVIAEGLMELKLRPSIPPPLLPSLQELAGTGV